MVKAVSTPTRLRMAAFIAQIGHESGQFRYVRELGGDAYLAKYDTGKLAQRLGNTPEADGDGQKYRGRGLIQVTGRANYEACSEALFGDSRLLATPELLEQPVYASMSAGWFWHRAGLNTLADKGDFLTITKRINGGTNGLEDREALYKLALEVLQ
ncbi:glycoside hydrolase family 19 protein [Pseudomonas tussilaginis]|uniref:glycoside hydrolase family 19 protein n=1 Tax=unclassified Pseudomonas TaxID=196821 RepID=UPI001C73DAC1|nr:MULTISPECIES: glycoside hydrolase family 19 protein [unclassified Pseudomonas]QYX49981.1 glycoside hydrolase family 19 protein [Pseudomonas sp. S11A 273]